MFKKYTVNIILYALIVIIFYFIYEQFKNLQSNKIATLINEVELSEKVEIKFKKKQILNNKTDIVPNIFLETNKKEFKRSGEDYHEQYAKMEKLVLLFDFKKCEISEISFLIKYNAHGSNNRLNFSKLINLKKKDNVNYIFFPVFYTLKDDYKSYFYSLQFHSKEYQCLDKIYKIKNPNKLTMPSFAVYNDDIKYLRFSSINHNDYGNVSKKEYAKKIEVEKKSLVKSLPIKFLHHAKNSINCIQSNCSSPNTCYLNALSLYESGETEKICSINSDFYKLNNIFLNKDNIIIIQGKIINGKFKINITNDDNFYYGEFINTNGDFHFGYRVKKKGIYKIIFSNKNDLYHYTENNIEIDNILIIKEKN